MDFFSIDLLRNPTGTLYRSLLGVSITMTWHHPDTLSDIDVLITTDETVPSAVLTGISRIVASKPRRRRLEGNLQTLGPVIRRLVANIRANESITDNADGGYESVIDSILCHTRGEPAVAPCKTCMNETRFGRCFIVPNHFDNACADCIFTGRPCDGAWAVVHEPVNDEKDVRNELNGGILTEYTWTRWWDEYIIDLTHAD